MRRTKGHEPFKVRSLHARCFGDCCWIDCGDRRVAGFRIAPRFGTAGRQVAPILAVDILGYGVNIVAVPLLAFAPNWQTVAMLVVFERIGKSVRAPARDVMLSNAAQSVGAGWGFGLHAAMDQVGAVLGPLAVAAIYAWRHDYRAAFLWLGLPALATMVLLFWRSIIIRRKTRSWERRS